GKAGQGGLNHILREEYSAEKFFRGVAEGYLAIPEGSACSPLHLYRSGRRESQSAKRKIRISKVHNCSRDGRCRNHRFGQVLRSNDGSYAGRVGYECKFCSRGRPCFESR